MLEIPTTRGARQGIRTYIGLVPRPYGVKCNRTPYITRLGTQRNKSWRTVSPSLAAYYSLIRKSYPILNIRIALRLAVKAMNDSMGPEGLVPSLLALGVVPPRPVINKPLLEQRETMAKLSSARAEMATITI